MPLPNFQDCMLPLLKLLNEKKGLYVKEAVEIICDQFNLTDDERSECVPSGPRRIANNIWWARNYLLNAGLLSSPRRGYVEITEEGRKVVASSPEKMDRKFLLQFPPYRASYTSISRKVDSSPTSIIPKGSESS